MREGHIIVEDLQGCEHRLDALEGWRVMEIIRDHGLPIGGLCGGACACATCHVYVAEEWHAALYPAGAEEVAMLDEAVAVEPSSRLSCQLIWTAALDGLRLRLAPAA